MTSDQLCHIAALVCFILAAGGAKVIPSWRDLAFAFLVLSLLV